MFNISRKKSNISKIAIIGCSCGGKQALDYLVPKLEIGDSSVIIAPHIQHSPIIDSLKEKHIMFKPIKPGSTKLKPGNLYIMHERWAVGFKSDVLTSRYVWGGGSINKMLESASEKYKEKCIAAILSGAGDDGSESIRTVKSKGGKAFIQIEGRDLSYLPILYYTNQMGVNALKSLEKDPAYKPDFAGTLAGMVDALNNELNSSL